MCIRDRYTYDNYKVNDNYNYNYSKYNEYYHKRRTKKPSTAVYIGFKRTDLTPVSYTHLTVAARLNKWQFFIALAKKYFRQKVHLNDRHTGLKAEQNLIRPVIQNLQNGHVKYNRKSLFVYTLIYFYTIPTSRPTCSFVIIKTYFECIAHHLFQCFTTLCEN